LDVIIVCYMKDNQYLIVYEYENAAGTLQILSQLLYSNGTMVLNNLQLVSNQNFGHDDYPTIAYNRHFKLHRFFFGIILLV
jgi:hypothetical protein